MDEHLIHSGLSKRGFLRYHNFRSSILCCSEDERERILAHLQVATLRGLRTQGRLVTQPLSLKRFTTFKMVCHVGCGPSRKRSRYRIAADLALRPHSQ
ncbi:hypothetical protein AVEN_166582-1 [Araneus ventricosus]|uniref:Uncharacterized protein n=1 Tax=Araneus ventricosus TaxID=182803 RepID=A0A4Y2KIY0_ARAVE|nr:hypothetical protein AVEN_166582-1 [Araneus ventricosus]